jgi:hypothetical protein
MTVEELGFDSIVLTHYSEEQLRIREIRKFVIDHVDWAVEQISRGYYVYHLIDTAGEIVYVGMTANPYARLVTHLSKKAGVVGMVIVKACDNPVECFASETEEIARLNPKYNRTATGGPV